MRCDRVLLQAPGIGGEELVEDLLLGIQSDVDHVIVAPEHISGHLVPFMQKLLRLADLVFAEAGEEVGVTAAKPFLVISVTTSPSSVLAPLRICLKSPDTRS